MKWLTTKLKAGITELKTAVKNGENPLAAVQKASEELVSTIKAVKAAYDNGETDIETALKAVDDLNNKNLKFLIISKGTK